jgi:hypothetical protein
LTAAAAPLAIARRSAGPARALLAPLTAFVAAELLLAIVMRYGGFAFLSAHSYERWDASIYLDIARYGYLEECSPGKVCGNGGWFPLYPALIWPFRAVFGLPVGPVALAISSLMSFAFLAVVWNGFLVRLTGRAPYLALAAAAVAPGMIYQHALFPLGLTATALALALWMLRDGRWLAGGLAAGVAAASYPGAALVAPIVLVWLVLAPATPWRERIRRSLVFGLPAVAGTLAVFLYAQLRIGEWDVYFDVQSRFDHGLHVPLEAMVRAAIPHATGLGGIGVFVAFQEWLVAVLVGLVAFVVWRDRGTGDRFDLLLVLYALGFWIVPYSQANVADYRTAAMLAPLTIVVARLRPLTGWAFVLASGFVAAGMSLAYFQGFLV